MQLISATTLGTAQNDVTIGSIPSTYDTLWLMVYARTVRTSENAESLFLRFNTDTSSNTNYTNIRMYAQTPLDATTDSNSGGIRVWVATDKNISGIWSTTSVMMPGYKTTTLNKKVNVWTALPSGSADTNFFLNLQGLWGNTAAINSIYLVTESGGNMLAGSSFYLYGL